MERRYVRNRIIPDRSYRQFDERRCQWQWYVQLRASQASNANCVAAPALSADVIGGRLPQAWRDYILENTIGHTKFRETTFSFNVDGPLFKLPGGDAQLALGAEYRKQSINDTPDENAINGNLLGLTTSDPTVGKDNVKEIYGELFLPLLSDTPRFLSLEPHGFGAVHRLCFVRLWTRRSRLPREWEPIKGFAVRGSYGTSYRAPALAEQFLGATSGFFGSDLDPAANSSTRRADAVSAGHRGQLRIGRY